MFNETYDLIDFSSFAEFIQNAKSVIENENCEFIFKSDKEFTDRDLIGWSADFNLNAGYIHAPLLSFDMHFIDEDKPRMALTPRLVQNANRLLWQNNTWRLDLDFFIENCEDVTNSIYSNKSGQVNYSDIYISRDGAGGKPRLIIRLVGKTSEQPYTQWESVSATINSLPIVEKGKDASAYINNDDTSVIYDSSETPKEYENPPKLFYMYSGLYSVNSDYADKQQEYYKKVEFKIPAGVRFCYYLDNESRSNVMLELEPCEFQYREEINGVWSDWATNTSLSVYKSHYFADIDDDSYITFNNRYYYSSCFTNIPKAKNKEDADSYLDYSINDDEMSIQQREHPNKTGDKVDTQTSDLQANTVRAILSRLYRFTFANLRIIADVIFNTNAGEIENLLKGLEMYGNNPIACITDLYYTPIDLSDFCDWTTTNGVKFGSYLATPSDLSVQQINWNSGIKTLANTFIHGQYGDWRDTYLVSYKLYLPFVGIVDLDANMYVDKIFTLKCTYDLRSHNLKYYLFTDNKLIQTFEGALGVSFVIMGNDTSAKASQNLQSLSGMAQSATSLALSVGKSVNPVGIASSIGDMAMNVGSTIVNMTKEAPTTISGNVSPASACNDVLYPYLIVKTQEHDYPKLLVQQFGMPCNVVNKIGNSRGFTIADNINLTGSMTDEEKKEIISLFKGGVII